MKNVLLLVHDDPGQEARFQAALDLTRALGGHLTCLDVTVMPVVAGDFYAASVEVGLLAEEREREANNRERLEQRLAREDVSWSWIDVTGQIASSLADAAKMADVVVVNRSLDSTPAPDMRYVAGEVVIASGKAVVAVPEDTRGLHLAGAAMVAWDGSKESMKALQSAVPLLRLASTVTLVEVDDGSIETVAEEAAVYLSRHDVHPVVVRPPADLLPIGDTLLAEAERIGANYIVMGGFPHGRLVETLFGGVSREMLTECPTPVVMQH